MKVFTCHDPSTQGDELFRARSTKSVQVFKLQPVGDPPFLRAICVLFVCLRVIYRYFSVIRGRRCC